MNNVGGESPHPCDSIHEILTPSKRHLQRKLYRRQNRAVKFGRLWSPTSSMSLWTPWPPLCPPHAAKPGGSPLGGWCRACSATVLGLCWDLGDAGSRGGLGDATPGLRQRLARGRCGHRRQKLEQAWDCCDLGPDQPSPERCKVGERLNLPFPQCLWSSSEGTSASPISGLDVYIFF